MRKALQIARYWLGLQILGANIDPRRTTIVIRGTGRHMPFKCTLQEVLDYADKRPLIVTIQAAREQSNAGG